jgi:hypothetical protein
MVEVVVVVVVVEVLAKHARGTARPVMSDILIAAVAMAVCVFVDC